MSSLHEGLQMQITSIYQAVMFLIPDEKLAMKLQSHLNNAQENLRKGLRCIDGHEMELCDQSTTISSTSLWQADTPPEQVQHERPVMTMRERGELFVRAAQVRQAVDRSSAEHDPVVSEAETASR